MHWMVVMVTVVDHVSDVVIETYVSVLRNLRTKNSRCHGLRLEMFDFHLARS